MHRRAPEARVVENLRCLIHYLGCPHAMSSGHRWFDLLGVGFAHFFRRPAAPGKIGRIRTPRPSLPIERVCCFLPRERISGWSRHACVPPSFRSHISVLRVQILLVASLAHRDGLWFLVRPVQGYQPESWSVRSYWRKVCAVPRFAFNSRPTTWRPVFFTVSST